MIPFDVQREVARLLQHRLSKSELEILGIADQMARQLHAAKSLTPRFGLKGVTALRRQIDRLEEAQVRNARRLHWPWGSIATALGVSRQAVHKRYAKPKRKTTTRASARMKRHMQEVLIDGRRLPGSQPPDYVKWRYSEEQPMDITADPPPIDLPMDDPPPIDLPTNDPPEAEPSG